MIDRKKRRIEINLKLTLRRRTQEELIKNKTYSPMKKERDIKGYPVFWYVDSLSKLIFDRLLQQPVFFCFGFKIDDDFHQFSTPLWINDNTGERLHKGKNYKVESF